MELMSVKTLTINEGLRYHQAGKLEKARDSYARFLRQNPKNAAALHLAGILEIQLNHLESGIELLGQAIENSPNTALYYLTLGNALKEVGWADEAIQSLARAIELKPDYIEAAISLGNLYKNLNRKDEAIQTFEAIYKHYPRDVALLNDMGTCYARFHLPHKALQIWEEAHQLDPEAAQILSNLGTVYHKYDVLSKAMEYLNKAISKPHPTGQMFSNLANVYKDMGMVREAIEYYRKALKMNPDEDTIHSNLLLMLNYDEKLPQSEIHREHVNWNNLQTKDIKPLPPVKIKDRSHKRIRIGYLSADFRSHSVAFFFQPLIQSHHADRVETYCYFIGTIKDRMTALIEKCAHHWYELTGLREEAIAHQIREDEIDILIDLSGHTGGNHMRIFAFKSAPIQMTWLGYPNTTGMSSIDYRITDTITDPIGIEDEYYTEKRLRLPRGFLVYRTYPCIPEVAAAPCLKNGTITFGSFNVLAKINEDVVAVWAEILKRIPQSKLMLKAKAIEDDLIKNRIYELFSTHQIEPDRLILVNRTYSYEEHMALYGQMDIALDPFPYNGTTTTCEALMMGVPVLALNGNRHSARVSASILHQIGMQDWVAQTIDAYIEKAVFFGAQFDHLSKLRNTMRYRLARTPLVNADNFAQHMETLYEECVQKQLNIESLIS
jgi:predicted O-linked N-acetylglucosamine transferase (SPINDLY family)